MFDPYNPQQLQRLNRACRASYQELETFRKKRAELVKEYTGTAYSDSSSTDEMPVNMLALTVDVYMMYLAGSAPQVVLPAQNPDVLPALAEFEAIVNKELTVMNFANILQDWVQEAFFLIGILKTGLTNGEYVELIPGQPQPTQKYFAEVIDFDDFVYDVRASKWDKVTYMGDSYWVDYDALMDDPDMDERAKADVARHKVADAAMEETDRVSAISGYQSDNEDIRIFKEQVRVWDIFLPEEQILIRIPDSESVSHPLKVVKWDGAFNSPYHILNFGTVPGNTMPLAPGQLLKSLNRTINAIYRKLVRQAQRQKTLGLFRIGNTDDARKVQMAKDGELVPVEHPDTVTEVNFGGPSQENLAFAMQARDTFSMLAGNIDALGGLGPQSETYRQDAMIQATVSKKASKMTRAVVDATQNVVKDLLHRIYYDPFKTYTALLPVEGTNFQYLHTLTPGERRFELEDFDLKIEPYSMQYQSPTERANAITMIVSQLALPMMPFLQQQGIGLDAQALFSYLSKYLSLPELRQILQNLGSVEAQSQSGEQPRQSPVSHRTYERVNRPGATRQGNTQTMLQAAAGANPQGAQRAALSRSTGV